VTETMVTTQHRLLGPWQLGVGALLRDLRVGELVVGLPDGADHVFRGREPGTSARIDVRDTAFARRLLCGADVGLAEGFMEGQWDTPDLHAVLELGLANLSAGWMAGLPVVRRPFQRLRHRLHDNDPKRGSRRNIEYHYDLGNPFYALWLDETMTYSAACFETTEDLAQAQRAKWERMLQAVGATGGEHLLEIGCGWGGFAIHAAKTLGCRVTGLTLSTEQADYARSRVAEEGLENSVDIRLEDYRDASGRYDGVVSIEMFEAVGERWWPTFFERVAGLLKAGAAAAIQTITIDEAAFEHYRRNPDFIQRYVFPGGMLPSVERFKRAATAAGLSVGAPYTFGPDYARTLHDWAERFERVVPKVRALGYDERFVRMWRYYLAYCEVGFESGGIDVMQIRMDGAR